MARKYSRDKGQAGSTKPSKPSKPTWIRYKAEEVEAIIAKLAKEGKSASKIGIHLRDNFGIPDVKTITEKKISKILKEKNISPKLPEDLSSLLKRVIQIQKHIERNHKDQTAKRGLNLTESKVKALLKYYKAKKVLPASWKYDSKNVALLLR
ncbi:30S ribosomal protein S15 [Nanoarchaeota archaeon]